MRPAIVPPQPAPSRDRRLTTRGRAPFTIIELMIVLGIIMILASMLLPALAKARDRGRLARWAAHSASLRADDRLMLYYNLLTEDEGEVYLKNQTTGSGIRKFQTKWGDTNIPGSTASGVRRGYGRWGKNGLYFNQNSDMYRASKFRWRADEGANTDNPITVMWWQNLPNGAGRTNSAFSIGTNSPRIGSHSPWSNNNAYFDYGGTSGNFRINGQTNYGNLNSQWVQFAMVSEGNNGNFRAIYMNGEIIASADVSDGPDVPARIFTLGHQFNVGHALHGFIDEFAIYARVLSEDEIRAHYANGSN